MQNINNMKIFIIYIISSLFFLFLLCISVFSKKNIISCLSFILSVIFSSILFIILGNNFFSLVLIFLYIGAIMILMLFMIMMYNNNLSDRKKKYNIKYYFLLIVFFLSQSIFLINTKYCKNINIYYSQSYNFNAYQKISKILFNTYNTYIFIILGILLLCATICTALISNILHNNNE